MTEQPERSGFLVPDAFRGVILAGLQATKVVAHMQVTNELLGDTVDVSHLFEPPTPEQVAASKERYAQYRAEQEAQRVAAIAEWESVRERYADSPAVLAVLEIHQPTVDGSLECQHPVYGYESDAEDWPCSTYEAIRDAVASS